jgi:ABC-2 type transport system ATP-binding protein
MTPPLVTHQLCKRFGERTALRSLSLEIPAGRVVGLLGRNGAGKTTLLHLACGLLLPTSGTCSTLGRASGELESSELLRLGVVFQEGRFVPWMTVAQHLTFNASFYPAWDRAREQRLLDELELDPTRRIAQLSPGDQQKLGVLLGVCHRPQLLLMDEPMSALDPIARGKLLAFLIDLVREDGSTILISSHLLADVEKIIDWVVCLDSGELAVSAPFDELQESYAEWIVTAEAGDLPARFPESFVLTRAGDAGRARLLVHASAEEARTFGDRYRATIATRPLNLDQLFPLLIKERRAAA